MEPIRNLEPGTNNKMITKEKVKKFFVNNMVTILFVIVGYVGFVLSGLSLPFFLNDLIDRVARNSFLVLALIIPVLAGMGLNFAIVLGAMAGQAAIFMVIHWGVYNWVGILLCVAVSTPIALLLGYLTGKLLNKTKGQEMITALILGFFANGVYQFIFIVLVGSPVIPIQNEELILSTGVGMRANVDLAGKLRYAIDDIFRFSFMHTILIIGIVLGAIAAYLYIKNKKSDKLDKVKGKVITYGISGVALVGFSIIVIMDSTNMMNNLRIPVVTFAIIGLLCFAISFIQKTKIGQDFRTVGQDQHLAKVSGINSDRIRVIAIIISTVLAAWGQIIYLQNMGNIATFGSHENIGMFSIAALLIGGASVTKATIGQALLGVVLFHTIFIVSPLAGRNLFGDAQLGEYFRAFVAYGVIGVSLGMHAWKKQMQGRKKTK